MRYFNLVSRNELIKIPEEICELKCLEELSLSENKLTELPQSMGNLTNLKALSASRNQIEVIPKSLFSLEKLVLLRLTDNLIEDIPEDLLLGLKSLSLFFSNPPHSFSIQTKNLFCSGQKQTR